MKKSLVSLLCTGLGEAAMHRALWLSALCLFVMACNGNSEVDEVDAACGDLCTPDECGDWSVSALEECDDGFNNGTEYSFCDATCKYDVCGNGSTGAGEECDDGNDIDGDGCHQCLLPNTSRGTFELRGSRLRVTSSIVTLMYASADSPWIHVASTDGTLLHTFTGDADDPVGGSTGLGGLFVDGNNNIYATRLHSTGPYTSNGFDSYVAAVTVGGYELWEHRVDKPGGPDDLMLQVASASGNYVLFAGTFDDRNYNGTSSIQVYGALVLYNLAGELLHHTNFLINESRTRLHYAIVFSDGRVCAHGIRRISVYPEADEDWIGCFDATGVELWSASWDQGTIYEMYENGGAIVFVHASGTVSYDVADGTPMGASIHFDLPAGFSVRNIIRDGGYFLVSGISEDRGIWILNDDGAVVWSTHPGEFGLGVGPYALGDDGRLYAYDTNVSPGREIVVFEPKL